MLLLCCVLAHEAAGQSSRGRVAGRILDASTDAALPGATVLLEPLDAGALGTSRASGFPAAVLTDVSGKDGSYAFGGLPRGRYVIRVQRIGYRSARVEVTTGLGPVPRLAVGLVVAPISLEPMVVEAVSRNPTRRAIDSASEATSRESALLLRRARYLEPDVQLLAGDDVRAAITVGEDDLFRALQRVPGISTRDEYAAELWTRGSPWGQTQVYLDALPLFDPFFGGGAMTAIAPSAVGAVFLHPGARPVSMSGGAAGVVRIATRTPVEEDGLPFLGEMGIGSMQGTVERRFLGGRAGVLISGRRSWFDQVWNTFVDDGHDPEGPFDYVVSSSLWRFDLELGREADLVFSSFRERDRVGGNVAMLITATEGDWGNAADQVSLGGRLLGTPARLSVGSSRYDARVEPAPGAFFEPLEPRVAVLRPGSNRIRHYLARLDLGETPGGVRGRGLTGGAEFVRESLSSYGSARVGSVEGATWVAASASDRNTASLWAEYRARLSSRIELQGGLRVDLGGGIAGAGSVRPAPHVALRVSPLADWFVTAAGSRGFQYLQQLSEAGTSFAAGHTFAHTWALAGQTVPLLESDISTLGVERRLDSTWWLTTNAWTRRSRGIALADPAPGLFASAPVRWRAGTNQAQGLELQLRRLMGRLTGQVSYSLLRSTDHLADEAFASRAGRTHGFDAVLRWQARKNLALGTAFAAYSGAPYSRVVPGDCVDHLKRAEACPGGEPLEAHGPASGARGPGYSSLDINLDWMRRSDTWGWGVTVQLRNVLGRSNLGGYRGTECPTGLTPLECATSPRATDLFQELSGFSMPFVGLRVWF